MEKEQLLIELQNGIESGKITRDEVKKFLMRQDGEQEKEESVTHVLRSLSIGHILSFIGGFIVILGIVILVGQNWEALGVWGRILVTFGTGVTAYVIAVIFGTYARLDIASQALYLPAGILIPGGLGVVLAEFGSFGVFTTQIIISALSLVLFAVTFFMIRKTYITLIFTIAFGTWLLYVVMLQMLDQTGTMLFDTGRAMAYFTLAVGVGYILGGYSFKKTPWYKLTSSLYALGVLGILIPAVSLGGVWDVLFAGIVSGVLFLSAYLGSRMFLIFGSLFLMIYVIKLTAEYFADAIGWPVALVVLGLALIGVGYMAYSLNDIFISRKKS